jgi:hypothetical protein
MDARASPTAEPAAAAAIGQAAECAQRRLDRVGDRGGWIGHDREGEG